MGRMKREEKRRLVICGAAGGFCFSLMWALGAELDSSDTIWQAAVGRKLLCLFFPFTVIVSLILFFSRRLFQGRRYLNPGKYWYFYSWGLIFLCWIPVWLASWPGIFSYDSAYQIDWFLTGNLTGHHPLLHTVYLGGCIALGQRLFHSDTAGALFYVISQMLILSAMMAGIHMYILRKSRSLLVQIGTLLFFALHPWNSLLSICATKDVLFGGAFGILIMQLMEAVENPESFFQSRKKLLLFAGSLLLVFLLRNNGVHTFLLCFPFLLWYFRRNWKKITLIFALGLGIYFLYTGPVYQMLGVKDGESREMLSVVMQQVARAYRDTKESWTEEEKEAVFSVIQERGLRRYHSHISDPVKDFFDSQAFEEDPQKFLSAWLNLGIKNPKLYVDSFLANTYGFWYPLEQVPESSGKRYVEYECYTPCETFTLEMKPWFPGFSGALYELCMGYAVSENKAAKFFLSTAFSFWVLVLGTIVLVYQKETYKLTAILPLYAYFFTVLLGPVALMRYVYCMIVCIPLVIFWAFEGINGERNRAG